MAEKKLFPFIMCVQTDRSREAEGETGQKEMKFIREKQMFNTTAAGRQTGTI